MLPVVDAADREWASQKWHTDIGEPTYREALIQSQAAWTSFRDAQCQIEMYEFRGGASEGQHGAECESRINRERIAQLQKMQKEL